MRHWIGLLGVVAGCVACSTGATRAATESPSTTLRSAPATVVHAIHGAGPCYVVTGSTARLRYNADGTSAECLVVSRGQRLELVNATSHLDPPGRTIRVQLPSAAPRTLRPGQAVTFPLSLGHYLHAGFQTLTDATGSDNVGLYLCTGRITVRPALECVVPAGS